MRKKIIALIILFVSIVTFSGCANADYVISFYNDGRISERFSVELNVNAITLAGYNYDEVKNEILSYFNTVRISLINSFLSYNNDLLPTERSLILNNIQAPNVENNIISINFMYDNMGTKYTGYQIYKLFYGVNDEDDDESNVVVEDNLFFLKTTTKTTSIYGGMETSNLRTTLLEYFANYENANLIFTDDDVNFTYSYAHNSSKIYSNADKVYTTYSGLKVHEWEISSENYSEEIEFYQYQIISTWWYVLALAITVLFIIGALLYYFITKKKDVSIVDAE